MAIGVNAKRRMSAFTVDFGYEGDSSFCRKSAYNSQDFALMRGLETVLKGEDFQTGISNLPPKFAFRDGVNSPLRPSRGLVNKFGEQSFAHRHCHSWWPPGV